MYVWFAQVSSYKGLDNNNCIILYKMLCNSLSFDMDSFSPGTYQNFLMLIMYFYAHFGFFQVALDTCAKISRTINTDDVKEISEVVTATIGTKFSARWYECVLPVTFLEIYNAISLPVTIIL